MALASEEPAYIVSDKPADWATAKDICAKWGGRLATIHS